jgi:hypothetical protein
MLESFSQRHGLAGPRPGTPLRDEVPPSLRMFLLDLSYDKHFDHHELQNVICRVLQVWPDPSMPPYYDCEKHIKACEWFHIYDIIEGIYKLVDERSWRNNPGASSVLAQQINKAFVEQNIGWQLVNGKIVTRGDEAFERTIEIAAQELAGRETTRARIQEAINDLSRRPKPDLSGAVSHAFAAMECIIGDIKYTAEEIRQDTRHTFGSFLQRHTDLFPSEDLKDGFQRLWKYANNEGSRHGKEGVEPALDEAELMVSLAAALVTYLNRKHPK